MPTKSRPSARSSSKPRSADGDGNQIHNQLLLGLPPREFELLPPKLEFVRLKIHHVLHEPGDTLKSAYFCNNGLVSILSVFPDGKSVEVGLVGKEGFIGLPLVVAFAPRPREPSLRLRLGFSRGWRSAGRLSAASAPDWSGSCTVFANHGDAGHTDCGLQSSARSK